MPPRVLTLRLAATDVPACPDEHAQACCLHCEEALTLHQPEPEAPRRLLGICEACGNWYLLDWSVGEGDGLMVLLPGPDDLSARFLAGPDGP